MKCYFDNIKKIKIKIFNNIKIAFTLSNNKKNDSIKSYFEITLNLLIFNR